jgi:hypothetical protein
VHFIGIDVQIRRRCPFVVLDASGTAVESGWLPSSTDSASSLGDLVDGLRASGPVHVGIDAPRMPLPELRRVGFRGGRWGPLQGRGLGRHCEVVVRSLGLANPQWTPLAGEAPPWMELGFALFRAAGSADRVVEVFPSATYRVLRSPLRLTVDLSAFGPGPKDMLDAAAGAATVLALYRGAGCEVGGGDGLGTIALPRPLTEKEAASPVHRWP